MRNKGPLFFAVLTIALVLSTALLSRGAAEATTAPLLNPNLPPLCAGIDVILAIDRSSSIDPGELAQMQSAYKDFIDFMIPRGADISLVTFSRLATVVRGFTDDADALKSDIDSITTADSTNWGHALYEARQLYRGNPTLVLLGSDGNVNTIGGFGSYASSMDSPVIPGTYDNNSNGIWDVVEHITADVTGDGVIDSVDAIAILDADGDGALAQPPDSLEVAVQQANSVKGTGMKIIALAIGDNLNVDSLKQVADEDDIIQTDFSSLGGALANVYDILCNQVTVDVTVDGVSNPPPYLPPADYTVEWQTRLARMCVAGGDWGGTKFGATLNGTQDFVNKPPGRYPYSLTCGASLQVLDLWLEGNCVVTSSGLAPRCWGTGGAGTNWSAYSYDYFPSQPYHIPVAVTVGWRHDCHLRMDGNVYCEGWHSLADYDGPGTTGEAAASDYEEGDAVAVDAGFLHTCALLANGNVDCWGINLSGQSEDYTGGDAVAVAAGIDHTCILKEDGSIFCQGKDKDGSVSDANAYSDNDAVQISADFDHTCIVKSNGNVVCFGLGVGPPGAKMTNPYTGNDAIEVAAGNKFRCVLKNDGNVVCDGGDVSSGLSTGYSAGDALFVEGGMEHACVINASGRTKCWGNPAKNALDGYLGSDAGRLGFDTVVVDVSPFTVECGNGIIEIGEQCDGTNLGAYSGLSCVDAFGSDYFGTLACDGCRLVGCEPTIPDDTPPGATGTFCPDGSPAGTTQCSDCVDNDGDGLRDRDDPGCWIDPKGGPALSNYNAADDSENNCGNGICEPITGENPLRCPDDCRVKDQTEL